MVTICTASLALYSYTFCPFRVYLCVLCGSQNKQRLFPYTALTSFCSSKAVCVCLLCVHYGWNNGPGSVPHQCTWDFWCTRLHWDRFFSSTVSLASICHQRSLNRTNRRSVGPFHRGECSFRSRKALGAPLNTWTLFVERVIEAFAGLWRVGRWSLGSWVGFRCWHLERGAGSVAPSAVGWYRIEKNHVAF